MRAIISIALIVVTGCASIIAPGPDRVMVATNPPGATIYLDGCYVGATPGMIQVDRGSAGVLILRKDGYQPFGWQIARPINGWFFGNVCFGLVGVVGMIIDGASGNITKYSTDPISVSMRPTSVDSI